MNNNEEKNISVVIPAFNEEGLLSSTINKHLAYLRALNRSFEIIIINDGSSDKTSQIGQDLANRNNEVKLINHKTNQGKALSVKNGMLSAKGKIRLFIDADNATSINHLDLAWEKLKNGSQIIIGSRNPQDAKGAKQTKKQALHKRLFGRGGNYIVRKITGQKIHDTQCGFKIFTNKAAEKIFKHQQSTGWLFDVELLLLAKRFEYKISAIPVQWQCGPASRVKLLDYAKSLLELWRIRRFVESAKLEKSAGQGSE